jgi:squalene-hopene/tetraprenyl-beta-curcumene cyclase
MTIRRSALVVVTGVVWAVLIVFRAVPQAAPQGAHSESASWSPRVAAGYLDGRMDWWLKWPNAARDHDTSCVSCHTALPYALARPALHAALGEHEMPEPERAMLAHVVKRVRMWNEVEPFYPDQTRGLPKSSESRGTESVMNALVLATRDASTGTLSEDTERAFANMWALQFKAGDLKGGWAWLNFHYEPWESTESPYYGAALAALAVGTAPGGYASRPPIQDQLTLLRDYVTKGADKERLFNRLTALWASARLTGLLAADQQRAIAEAANALQQADGGWSTSALGSWKRVDNTPLDTASDGYATGLVTVALSQSGVPRTEPHLSKALA